MLSVCYLVVSRVAQTVAQTAVGMVGLTVDWLVVEKAACLVAWRAVHLAVCSVENLVVLRVVLKAAYWADVKAAL